MNEKDKIIAIGYFLINLLRKTEGDTLRLTQEKVTYMGENIGNYEIIVRKIEDSNKSDTEA